MDAADIFLHAVILSHTSYCIGGVKRESSQHLQLKLHSNNIYVYKLTSNLCSCVNLFF